MSRSHVTEAQLQESKAATAAFEDLVAQRVQQTGCTRATAVQYCRNRHSDAHRRMVEAANPNRSFNA